MKAIVMTRYGGPEVMELQDVAKPEPTQRDVLVEVHAVGLNPVDFKIREGLLKQVLKYKLPVIMGQEFSGVIVEVGMRARHFKVGDKVYARVQKERIGTFGEFVAVERTDVAPMPKTLSFEEAASIPLVGLTAWQCLVDTMKLSEGQKILIHAGAGGVGTFAIQLAKHLGAHVTTTASAKNHEMLKGLGADDCIDYNTEDFADRGPQFDFVLDGMGGSVLMNSFKVIKPGGMVLSISALPDEIAARKLGLNAIMRFMMRWMNRKVTAAAKQADAQYRFLFMEESEAQLRRIGELIDKGEIKPVIDSVYPLEAFKDAFAKLEEGHARGKIVMRVKDEGAD